MTSPIDQLRLVAWELRSLRRARSRSFREAEWGGGSLRYEGGIPILRLSGTPGEMGLQHGRILGNEVRELADAYLDRFLKSYAGLPGGRDRLFEISARMGRHLPEHHREELRGFAEGADLSEERALLFQTFVDIHKLCFCSTFVARSATGPLQFGRNLDFPSMGVAQRYGLVIIHRGEGRREVATVGWPGMLGTLSGMNDSGLTLAVMVVYFVSDVEDGYPYPLLFRSILEEEHDLTGVERRLTQAANTNSNHLMAATGTGDAALFSIRPEGVTRQDREDPVLCSTNHFLGAGRQRLRIHPLVLSSLYRFSRLRRVAREVGDRPTLADVIRALRRTGPPLGNLQSMVFLPEERRILLSLGTIPAARGRFRPVDPFRE